MARESDLQFNVRISAEDQRTMRRLQRLLSARLRMGRVSNVSAFRHAIITAVAAEEATQKGGKK